MKQDINQMIAGLCASTVYQMTLQVTAPGKVILFGEHAVVYGKPAVACALGLETIAQFSPSSDVKLSFKDVNVDQQYSISDLNILKKLTTIYDCASVPDTLSLALVAKITEFLAPSELSTFAHQSLLAFLYVWANLSSDDGLSIDLMSNLPIGAGLGSSASFSTVIVTGLLVFYNHFSTELTLENKNLINKWAFLCEKIIHGNPSGVDNAICVYGGAKLYSKQESCKMIDINGFESLEFLLTDTKYPKNTKRQVEIVRKRYEKYPKIMKSLFDSIEFISTECKSMFESDSEGIHESLEELIDINHFALASCGMSHPSLEKIRAITEEFQLHTKLTGAGGGGCALTLLKPGIDKSILKNLKKKLEMQGFESFEARLGGRGVGCEYIESVNE